MVRISDWIMELIREHYGACGLEKEVIRLIERLPTRMCLELGKSEEFWRKELEDPTSKINELNLLEGAIKFAVNKAKDLSEKTGRDVCEYLEDPIERGWRSTTSGRYPRMI